MGRDGERIGRIEDESKTDVGIAGSQNSFLVKRSTKGPRFSRDPYNLLNLHSRKVCDIYILNWEIGANTCIASGIRQRQGMAGENY